MDKESPDCDAGPESLIQSQSKDWPVQKVLGPSILPRLELPGRAGLCRRAGDEPDGIAAGGWQLPAAWPLNSMWCL